MNTASTTCPFVEFRNVLTDTLCCHVSFGLREDAFAYHLKPENAHAYMGLIRADWVAMATVYTRRTA